ncbi:N-acetyltransferase 9-like protein [Pholiota molesta]|nr:N-acetyltransferase 9-like protein [Pholiota molesta]
MLSEELRTLTASEPLSLEEEYEMQGKWQEDEDKLTFIILSRYPIGVDSPLELPEDLGKLAPTDERLAHLPMVGDVNIFLYGVPPHRRSVSPSTTTPKDDEDDFYAEVEIMIAEPSFRRKGLALEALQLMLGYATGQPQAFRVGDLSLPHAHSFAASPLQIPPTSLVTKISDTNTPSIQLFEKLGFAVTKRVEVFQEVEMRYRRSIS